MTNPETVLFLLAVGGLLLSARAVGHLFDRVKLPPLLGQILAGLLFYQFLPALRPAIDSPALAALSDVGLLMLMCLVGMESRLADIRASSVPAFSVAFFGAVVPLAGGYAASRAIGLDHAQGLAVGAILGPTSIGITAVALLKAHRTRTPVGATLVGAAILDDIIILVLLAFLFGTGTIVDVSLKALLFLVGGTAAAMLLFPRLFALIRPGYDAETPLSVAFALALLFGAAAEAMGLAAVIGAFLAGLAMRETVADEKLTGQVELIAMGIFVPLFFAHLGASFRPADVAGALGAMALIVTVGLLAKFAGAALGALLTHMGVARAIQVGVGMLPRMEVSLVVAALAVRLGLFPGEKAGFITGVALLGMVASLILTPLLLSASWRLTPNVAPAAHDTPPADAKT